MVSMIQAGIPGIVVAANYANYAVARHTIL